MRSLNPVLSDHVLTGERLTARDHWRLGRLYRYPICCVAWFCVRDVLHICNKKGRRCGSDPHVWSGCGVFHKGIVRRSCWREVEEDIPWLRRFAR